MAEAGFWGDQAAAQKVMQRRKQIEAMEPRPMTTADATQGIQRGVR